MLWEQNQGHPSLRRGSRLSEAHHAKDWRRLEWGPRGKLGVLASYCCCNKSPQTVALIQYELTLFQLWGSKVPHESRRAKIKVLARLIPSGRSKGKSFSYLFRPPVVVIPGLLSSAHGCFSSCFHHHVAFLLWPSCLPLIRTLTSIFGAQSNNPG